MTLDTAPDRLLTCPLCGFEFSAADTLCQHGCPLRSACGLQRCPMCDYEFPETPKAVSWLRNLLRRRPIPPRPPGDVRTVRDLVAGEEARVVHLADGDEERSNALTVFGLTPGMAVTLVQRHPSYVVQVGETLLALDDDVAASIVVGGGADVEAPPA